jgi:hypothetical protein
VRLLGYAGVRMVVDEMIKIVSHEVLFFSFLAFCSHSHCRLCHTTSLHLHLFFSIIHCPFLSSLARDGADGRLRTP